MKYRLERKGHIHEIDVELTAQGFVLRGSDGHAELVQIHTRPDGSQHAVTPWGEFEVTSARRGRELWADLAGADRTGNAPRRLSARVERARPAGIAAGNGTSAGAVIAPMAGKLLRLDAVVGARFKLGQALAVIEAMKMENELVAPIDGVVVEVLATAPSTIEKGALIARLEPA
jgi:biotin carboxyl carrier protein